jgi:hypothetical protein
LGPETIRILKDAKAAVNSNEVVSRHAKRVEKVVQCSDRAIQINTTRQEGTSHHPAFSSFVVLPDPATGSNLSVNQKNITGPLQCQLASINTKSISTDSLKSSSSIESFKSALSSVDTNHTVVEEINAIQGILHAFRTALETLEVLVRKRISEKDGQLYTAAKILKDSLENGENGIRRTYRMCYMTYRQSYAESLSELRRLFTS